MDLDWDNYHYTFKNGETAYFKVDPSYADRAPLKALSNLVTCKMLVAHTQRNGSPTDPELQKIADFETKAVEVAKGAGENVYVGWVTSGNLAAVNFYASDGAALVKQLHISIKLLPITQFRCQTKVDAAWGFYLDFLYPPPMMKVHIDDDKRVAVLRRQGDDGVIRRKIEHFASFPTEAARSEFARFVEKDGFSVEQTPIKPEKNGKWPIVFSAVNSPAAISVITWALIKEAKRLHGTYGGWQSPVVKP